MATHPKDLAKLAAMANPAMAVNAFAEQAMKFGADPKAFIDDKLDMAKGLVDAKDWTSDHPLRGAGYVGGTIAQFLIPGAGEAKAGTEAAKAADEAAQAARTESQAARASEGVLGAGAESGIAAKGSSIARDLNAIEVKPGEVAPAAPPVRPPEAGPAPAPGAGAGSGAGPGRPPIDSPPAPHAGDGTHGSLGNEVTAPPGSGPPGGVYEPAPMPAAEHPTPAAAGPGGGAHEPAPMGAAAHPTTAPAAPGEPLPAPAAQTPHSPAPSMPAASAGSASQPTLASAHSPQTAPMSPAHEPIPDSYPGGAHPPEPLPPPHDPGGPGGGGGHDGGGGDGRGGGDGGGGGSGDGHGGAGGGDGGGHGGSDGHSGGDHGAGGDHGGDGGDHHGSSADAGNGEEHQPPTAREVFPDAKPYGDLTKEEYEQRFIDDDGNLIYPDENDPAKPYAIPGTVRDLTGEELMRLDGKTVDRIGHPGGAWFAPEGTPYEGRALPHESLDKELHKYVIYPENGLPPGWKLEESRAAPWFGQAGGEPQYRVIAPPGAKARVQDLIDRGFLEDICD